MVEIVLIFIIILLIGIILFILKLYYSLNKKFNELKFSKQSQSVKYGQLTEQWIPFSKNFPFPSKSFKFIGEPIDGIVFNDTKIVFVEFKTNKSKLSDSQKKIKELIDEKKVEWLEFRIE